MITTANKKISRSAIFLISILTLITLLKLVFLFKAFNNAGLENFIIYIVLILLVLLKKDIFGDLFIRMLILGSIITFVSMLLKLESYISSYDIIYLFDNTPCLFEIVKEMFISEVDSAPKASKSFIGPHIKPELVKHWLEGEYRQIAQSLGEGGVKSMTVGGFLLTCKPVLASGKAGKAFVFTSAMIPFIDHVVK